MEKDILRIEINAQDRKSFIELLQEYHLDTAAERKNKDGKIIAEAYVPSTQIGQLQKPGIEIKILENAVKTGIERQKQVSSVNTFALDEQKRVPKGLGKKE